MTQCTHCLSSFLLQYAVLVTTLAVMLLAVLLHSKTFIHRSDCGFWRRKFHCSDGLLGNRLLANGGIHIDSGTEKLIFHFGLLIELRDWDQQGLLPLVGHMTPRRCPAACSHAVPSPFICPIVNVMGWSGGWGWGWGGMTSCGSRLFEVPVLKEPLIAIRISLNKRLRNIGWFLAFACRRCLLTSEV